MSLDISPWQLAAAGSFIGATWGEDGYRITDIKSPTRLVSVFTVLCSDGSEVKVAVDRWGNVQDLTDADPNARVERVHAMHREAATP
jgi:hypothetical protein